ncbi:collagenase 3-like [Melanotaenia boesemani]|uniref:collagenase 3-like n=1 Tax=Melanotaenia boesemani TaxID=1250792 RepID=UPI001C058D68|nr:collagenase 3-like [Melanotaenia boesemani]
MRDDWINRRKYFNNMHLADSGILLLAWLTTCNAAPIFAPWISAEDEDLAKKYLSQYYSDAQTSPSVKSITENSFRETLRSMQAFFGLEVTGVLNDKTLEVMRAPRCGVTDVYKFKHMSGRPKWEKSLITYRITQYTRDLTQSQVDATIAQAFQLYSDVIPLDFQQIYWGTADIVILFQSGFHGDHDRFDGPGGTLAHAFGPGQNEGGDAHFDEDETWTLTHLDFNLLLVAAHEFGHSLGLDHSSDKSALMFPSYQYVNTYGYRLPDDDRRGVQALYGFRQPTGPQPGPDPVPLPNPQNQQCSPELVFDAVTSIWGDLFFFKNGYFWRRSTGFPKIRFSKVSTTWPQINHVDAAFEVPNRHVAYFFEGNQYWGITAYDKTIIPGFPQPITNFGLPSYVNKVDAAVYEPTTGRALMFVNNQYWSYNYNRNRLDYGYPRYISLDFPGIGFKVDAAFENLGYLYFIEGARQSEYYLPYRSVTRVMFNYEWLCVTDIGYYSRECWWC